MILRDFRKQIENIINESHLSIDCVYYVFSDIMTELKMVFDNEVEKENYERTQKEMEKEAKQVKDAVEEACAATEVSGDTAEIPCAGTDTAAGQE